MAASSSMAVSKRDAEMALMPPPPAPKRQKRPATVLDEDVYTDALSHIIVRDFFPGLRETEAQEEFMQALESKNNEWIRDAGRRLTQTMTPRPEGQQRVGRGTSFTARARRPPSETPRNFVGDTPGHTPGTQVNRDFEPEEKPEVDVNMSLAAFQAKYTSEDNESFNALLDKQNEKRAAKYAFFHSGNKIPTPRQIAHRAKERKLLEQKGQMSSALIVTNSAGDERLSIGGNMPSRNLNDRPASLDSFRNLQGPRNPFMFGPDGVEDQVQTSSQRAQAISAAPPKSVQHASTRFKTSSEAEEDVIPPSPSLSAIDAAISGRPKPTESESGYTGAETPRVNGYAFVDAEPTPSEMGIPVTDEEADNAEREAAMQLLPRPDVHGPNPFTIHERSKREDLHMKLVEKADRGRRVGSRRDFLKSTTATSGRTPTPKFPNGPSIRTRGEMTPAGHRLAQSIGTPSREAGIFGDNSKAAKGWTPTPVQKRR